jgi:ribonuclease HI
LLNFDGSFRQENKVGGWGFVIHNEDGETEAARTGNIMAVASMAQAEAIAML